MRLAWLAALLTAGCLPSKYSDPPESAIDASRDTSIVCHEVADTGSLFSHTECTRRRDAADVARPLHSCPIGPPGACR